MFQNLGPYTGQLPSVYISALLLLLRAFIQRKFARATNALQHATQIHMVTMQVHEIHTYYAVCGVMKSARGLF